MKYSISSDGTEVSISGEYERPCDGDAGVYSRVSIADMRTILAEMEAKYNGEDIESIDAFELDGVQYLAVPESRSDNFFSGLCDGCAFEDAICWAMVLPVCSRDERPDRKGIIWKAQ